MANVIISANKVKKTFTAYRMDGKKALSFIFNRNDIKKRALKGVSFEIKAGELVALLGKNGSGKSTMLKILTGILKPDEGTVNVLGFNPSKDREKLDFNIGVVLGSTHPQLYWDLPPLDAFLLMRDIYGIPDDVFQKRLKYFIKLLDLKDVYKRQTRQLSLGERMKCELVAANLHAPKIVFLDEPTIGVDLPSRNAIKEAIKKLRAENGTTFIITTHVVEDITEVDRIIVFDKGVKLFDGVQANLRKSFGKELRVTLYSTDAGSLNVRKFGKVTERGENFVKMKIKPAVLRQQTFMQLLGNKKVVDFRISEQSLSDILSSLYKSFGK
jgi:ABC-2 type transport system ATP-binding protein